MEENSKTRNKPPQNNAKPLNEALPQNKSFVRVFDTISDIGSLTMSAIYIMYVAIMLAFGFGVTWLNHCMIGITVLYVAFFVAKIMALNCIFTRRKVKKITRRVVKYSKWSMKLINAIFVILAVISARSDGNEMMLMIGVFIVLMTFTISLIWDVALIVIHKKAREMWTGWDKLSREEKNQRIDQFINSFIDGVDNIAGVNIEETIVSRRKPVELPPAPEPDPAFKKEKHGFFGWRKRREGKK